MQVARLLFSQGFGSRRECEGLCLAGRVRLGNMVDPKYTLGASILKSYIS